MSPSPRELRGGIDLGGTKIEAIVVDGDHNVRGQARRPTPTEGGPEAVAVEIAAALQDAAQLASIDVTRLSGIGVGTPGAVDDRAGTVAAAKNLPGCDGVVPLAQLLSKATGVAVHLGNDVGVALDAEARLGAGRDLASFVGVFWGTGIGGGVILHGKRWLGRGAAGELGHMVIKMDGAVCPCGRRGCVEAYAGRRSLEARARKGLADGRKTKLFKLMEKKGRDRLTSSVWAEALERDDELAHELVDRAVEALASGLASTMNLLDVEGVVIGGGLGTRLGKDYAERIREAMRPHLFVPDREPVVRIAELGDLSGAIGASLLVLDHKG
jgi:glucokinase